MARGSGPRTYNVGGKGPFGSTIRPVGYEREAKGYIVVKIAPSPAVPGSKDNWRLKHVVVWEKASGKRLPKGWVVMFADGDRRNFDPNNLVAVPRELVGVLNSGPKWHDGDSLRAAVELARLKRGIVDAEMSARHVCGVCGREFTPDIRSGLKFAPQRTCRECLDKGLRSPKSYGLDTCPECGREFERRSPRNVYCSKECWSAAYYRRRRLR